MVNLPKKWKSAPMYAPAPYVTEYLEELLKQLKEVKEDIELGFRRYAADDIDKAIETAEELYYRVRHNDWEDLEEYRGEVDGRAAAEVIVSS